MTAEANGGGDELRQRLAEREAEVEQLRRELRGEVEALNQLIGISTHLNSTLNRPELLRLIMESAKRLFGAEACSIMLVDEATGELVFEVSVGEKSEDVVAQRIPAGQGVAGRVVQRGEAMIVNSAKEDPLVYKGIDQSVGSETRNLLAVPMTAKGQVIGVVEVINKTDPAGFTAKDQALAQALANQAAVAIENARLYQKLAEALVEARMSYRL